MLKNILLPIGLVGAMSLSSCGQFIQEESHTSSHQRFDPPVELDFVSWCSEWSLDCTMEPSDSNTSWQLDEWKGLTGVARSFLDSNSKFSFSNSDLQDEKLMKAASYIGVDGLLGNLFTKIGESGWTGLTTEPGDGKLDFAFAEQGKIEATSGLRFTTKRHVGVRPYQNASLSFTGLWVSNENGDKSDMFTKVFAGEDNTLGWEGDDYKVNGIELAFIPAQLGFSLGELPSEFPIENLVQAAGPFLSWFLNTDSQFNLAQEFFQSVAQDTTPIVNDPEITRSLQAFADSVLTVVNDNNTANSDVLVVGMQSSHSFGCAIGDSIEVKFADAFGVTSVTELNGSGIKIILNGIKATIDMGMFKRTMNVEELDIVGQEITIYNVPIVGQYTIDLGQSDGSNKTVCQS